MYNNLEHWLEVPNRNEITLPPIYKEPTASEARLQKILTVSDAILDRMEEHAEDGDTELLCDLSHAYWNLVDASNRLVGY